MYCYVDTVLVPVAQFLSKMLSKEYSLGGVLHVLLSSSLREMTTRFNRPRRPQEFQVRMGRLDVCGLGLDWILLPIGWS